MKDLSRKCENVKEANKIGMEIVLDKYLEIGNLMRQIEARVVPAVNVAQSNEPNSIHASTVAATLVKPNSMKNCSQMFSTYAKYFNQNQLSYLRSVDHRKEMDSHFINTVVKQLYDGRLYVLPNRSVTGRSNIGQTKEAVTPEKRKILDGIYTERIFISIEDCAERVQRKKKLNKYIKDTLHRRAAANLTFNAFTCKKNKRQMNNAFTVPPTIFLKLCDT